MKQYKRHYRQKGGLDYYMRGGNVFNFQQGGEQYIPAPAFLTNPSLPPQAVTDPKAIARLYGIDSRPTGDIADSFHLRARDLLEQRAREAMAKKPAATNAAAAKEQQNKKPPPLPSNNNPVNSDIATYYNVPTGQDFDTRTQVELAERERLKHDLQRLGYNENQANYFVSKGKDKMMPTVRQQLEDQAVKDYRVKNHPDYDPSKLVEDQQNLDYDNSLRARLLRGRNMLVDTGNPITDLVAKTLTAPGKSFANLTMDANKQYVQPGLAQGVTNLGSDLMTLFPAVGEQAAAALVERAPAWAQGYLANPLAQGVEDLSRWYVPKGANSGTLNKILPQHVDFLKSVNQNLRNGISFKKAVESSYRPIRGDQTEGMSLVQDETPLEVYRQVKREQEDLFPGRMWGNPSYSTDSYPLMLDHIAKRLDPEKYKIISTNDYTPLNGQGFRSNDLLNLLPDDLKPTFKEKIDEINPFREIHRSLTKQYSEATDPSIKASLEEELEDNWRSAARIKKGIRSQFDQLAEQDPSIKARLLEGYNNRIQDINRQYGINMPLAKEEATNSSVPFFSSTKGTLPIMVPQFYIYKKDPNLLNTALDFPGRVGLMPKPFTWLKNRLPPNFQERLNQFNVYKQGLKDDLISTFENNPINFSGGTENFKRGGAFVRNDYSIGRMVLASPFRVYASR